MLPAVGGLWGPALNLVAAGEQIDSAAFGVIPAGFASVFRGGHHRAATIHFRMEFCETQHQLEPGLARIDIYAQHQC